MLGKRWMDICVEIGLCSSKGEVRRLIAQKGLYINNIPMSEHDVCEDTQVCYDHYVLLAQGKKKKLVVYLE